MYHTLDEEVEMASKPDRWPLGYVLPLKHRQDGARKVGFLVQPSMAYPAPPPEPVVYVGNIYLAAQRSEMPVERYPDLHALMTDWLID